MAGMVIKDSEITVAVVLLAFGLAPVTAMMLFVYLFDRYGDTVIWRRKP
jgi:hypothetical protein